MRSYEGEPISGPDPEAGKLERYRPFPEGWIERLWDQEYRSAWPTLQANAEAASEPPFPTPDEMLARTYVGNVAFEGDVREETEGSRAIEAAIMDDDPRTLWLLSWGGANTIVRALMSIAEKHRDTPDWEAVRQRVYQKVRVAGIIGGVGQDNSWLDHGRDLFPELKLVRVPHTYGGYVDAKFAQPDTLDLFRAPWPKTMLVDGNGPLMEAYKLFGDGKHFEGEPDKYQFGEHPVLTFGFLGEPLVFEPYDFLAEGDSMTYIPLLPFGLRGIDDPSFDTLLGRMFLDGEDGASIEAMAAALRGKREGYPNPNPFLRAYQEDFAARAQWCASEPAACNHAPVIAAVCDDATVAAGEGVALHATVSDPDGDEVCCSWHRYAEDGSTVWQAQGPEATFVVPADALPGNRYVLTLVARDAAERPMTRYAQVAVTVA